MCCGPRRYKPSDFCFSLLLCAEILFMPQFTWHNVFSTADTSTHMNVAVNFWLTGDTKYKQLFEALHRMLVGEEPEDAEEDENEDEEDEQ